jgi:hypothetical protein
LRCSTTTRGHKPPWRSREGHWSRRCGRKLPWLVEVGDDEPGREEEVWPEARRRGLNLNWDLDREGFAVCGCNLNSSFILIVVPFWFFVCCSKATYENRRSRTTEKKISHEPTNRRTGGDQNVIRLFSSRIIVLSFKWHIEK